MTVNKAKKLIRRTKRKKKIAKKKLESQAKYNAKLAKEALVPINITPISYRAFDKSAWNTTTPSQSHNVLGHLATKKTNGFDRASWNNEQRT
jgi:hypothetical protein